MVVQELRHALHMLFRLHAIRRGLQFAALSVIVLHDSAFRVTREILGRWVAGHLLPLGQLRSTFIRQVEVDFGRLWNPPWCCTSSWMLRYGIGLFLGPRLPRIGLSIEESGFCSSQRWEEPSTTGYNIGHLRLLLTILWSWMLAWSAGSTLYRSAITSVSIYC
jgi:hypothetical protein